MFRAELSPSGSSFGVGRSVNTITLIVAGIAANILSLALPIATLQIYDRVLPNQAENTMYVLLAGVALIIVLETVLRISNNFLISYSGSVFVHRTTCSAIRHILNTDAKVDSAKLTGTFLNKINSIRSLKDFNNGYSISMVVDLFFVPAYIALIAYIAGPLVGIPISILILFALVVASSGQKLGQALEYRNKADDTRYDYLLGTLNSSHAIKAFALEKILLRRYESLQSLSCLANSRVASIVTLTFNFGAVFAHVMTASLIGLGSMLVVAGDLSMGALIAVTLLSGRIMQPVQRGLSLWARHQEYRTSKEKVDELFDLPLAHVDNTATDPERLGHLRLDGVSFSHGDGPPLLNDISLEVKLGQSILIDGQVGAGKSTLLKLIAGGLQPSDGAVFIDGVASTHYAPGMLMNHIGFLSPEGVIFRGTIRDNITRFGQIPIAQAQSVAAMIGLTEEVAKLPAGFDTRLDASGTDSIPPGVKQRIALTRALASKPRVIVFDNADRSLDVDGYQKLFKFLGRLRSRVAMVIVSDDRNIAGLADRHLMLQNGRLVEVGEATARRPAAEVRL